MDNDLVGGRGTTMRNDFGSSPSEKHASSSSSSCFRGCCVTPIIAAGGGNVVMSFQMARDLFVDAKNPSSKTAIKMFQSTNPMCTSRDRREASRDKAAKTAHENRHRQVPRGTANSVLAETRERVPNRRGASVATGIRAGVSLVRKRIGAPSDTQEQMGTKLRGDV